MVYGLKKQGVIKVAYEKILSYIQKKDESIESGAENCEQITKIVSSLLNNVPVKEVEEAVKKVVISLAKLEIVCYF